MASKGKDERVRGLYRRKDSPHWWVSLIDSTGRRQRFSTHTTDRALAVQILKARQGDAVRGRFGIIKPQRTGGPLIEDLLASYLSWARGAKAPSSFRRDQLSARTLLGHLGGRAMNAITCPELEDYRQTRLASGVKPATVNREMAVLRHAYNRAIRAGLYENANPVVCIKPFKESPRRRYLSDNEQTRLLLACKNSKQLLLYPLVATALLTGLRAGELRALRWDDIDFRHGTISVRHSKTGERNVPLSSQAAAVLQGLERVDERVFPITEWKTCWRTALRRAGIKEFRFHDLRRTFAVNLSREGVDLSTIKTLLGHSQFSTSLIYLATSPKRLQQAVSVVRLAEMSCSGGAKEGLAESS